MKAQFFSAITVLSAFFSFNIFAATHYVDLNCANPVSPYTDWSTAATNIQNAVDAATGGDLVLVTNGIYATGGRMWADSGTNCVTLTNSITLQSVNGPSVTLIVGNQVSGSGFALTNAVRCVGMGNNAVLSGFTLTNGEGGWGNYPDGGGVAYIYGVGSGIVTNCILTGNLVTNSYYSGGGADRVTLINCKIIGNYAGYGGGADRCGLINCVVVSNTASSSGGGVYDASALVNCTIVGNSAAASGGGVDNTSSGAMNNCIVYYNTAPSGSNYAGIKMNYCCTTPILDSDSFTNAPLFQNADVEDFHLSPASPCINAGNNSFITNNTDLDGNPRIVAGTVDMGAYEFQSPVHYVNASNTAPISPFTNWITAATNIQDAVDVSTNGDLVLVTNGLYAFGGGDAFGSNRVAVTKAIVVQSVNGYAATVIQGVSNDANVRCVFLTNGATLVGFTLTNGSASLSFSAGGVSASGFNDSIVSNCLIIANSASSGGGAAGGALYNCVITENYGNNGGGVFAATMYDCLVLSNSAAGNGGGSDSGTAYHCQFIGNQSGNGGGGYNSSLFNCLLISNNATGSFGGGAAYQTTLVNCTVVGNHCTSFDGGFCGGALNGNSYNCILYNNTSLSHAATPNYFGGGQFYCCTAPLPLGGSGNFAFDPLLANPAALDFHLQSNSPCINAGNNSYRIGSTDLDGNARISGGTVDIGAYEFQNPASIISYAWLQQYGLPTDGTADDADSDGDGFSNWQEWIAGTNPTNSSSLLQMLSPVGTNNSSGVTVSWQSVSGINYYLQRGSDLSVQPIFSSIQSNIVGQAGTTSYTDSTATNSTAYFYRAGVQ